MQVVMLYKTPTMDNRDFLKMIEKKLIPQLNIYLTTKEMLQF